MFFIMSFPLPKPCNVIPLIVLKKAKINIRLRLKFSDNLTMQDLLEGLKQKKISWKQEKLFIWNFKTSKISNK